MKIRQLNIVGFGKLINQHVTLSDEMTLVFGQNEAGKSTMYQFIKTILFGFPRKNVSSQSYEPKEQALYGGELTLEHPVYGEIKIRRIKTENKGKAVVILENGSQADEKFLQEMLLPLNEELFDEVFRLDQTQLQTLSNLSEENLQKQLLNIGLTGSKKLVEFQEANIKAADQLYRPRGKNPKINQQLEEYEELKRQLTQKENEEKVYQKKLFDRDNLVDEMEDLQIFLQEETQLNEKLARRIEHFDDWQRYNHLKTEEDKQDIVLDEETLSDYRKAYQKYQILDEQERRLTEEQLRHSAKTESEALAYYLNNEDRFKQFQQDRPYLEKMAQEIDVMKASQADKQAEITSLQTHLKITQIEESFYPENNGLKEIQSLAMREKSLKKHYEEQQTKEVSLLQQKESLVTADFEVSLPKKIDYRYLYGAFGFSILGLGFVLLLKMIWFGSFFCLLALGLLGYFLYQVFQKDDTTEEQSQAIALVDRELEENRNVIHTLKQEEEKINSAKQTFAGIYQFNENKQAEQWLDEMTLRERLFDMQVSTQEMIEAMAINEKYLTDYLAINDWLVDRFSMTVEEMLPKLSEVTNYIHEMQQKQQQYLLEHSDTYQVFDSLKNARQQKNKLVNQFMTRLTRYSMESFEELPAFIRKQEEQQQLKQQLEHQTRIVSANFNPNAHYELEKLKQTHTTQVEKIMELQQQLKEIQEQYDALHYDIQRMEEDGSLSELYQLEANLRGEINQTQEEWVVNKLVTTLSQDIQDVMGQEQLPQLLAICSEYFNELTLGNYKACTFVEGQLMAQHVTGKSFTLNELSTGTKDQLYMAMRLAFLTLHSEEQLSPLLIDDSWLHYDSDRKNALFNALHKLSAHVQVICFSSDQSLKEFAEQQQVSVINL
ncbi:AAA family ATPase [Vagococcus xieshaowenii]|uniref:YhaN AAA domain-containing protein n=1 Tax=Vagococcus xieshaowenii TaxID=2562451 RepID=A0AAJ5JMB4_9ENTE|nr:AAA family ATPase [Vagococcus xieshaowenii]QCA29044.1 hypothetical protein E4Z98_06850 [Vagococcus xieshaowenii]TFZ40980.1 hypothetical protein E4031_06245 [Vagococcus xieshaowenii]